jgi:hypothetical protein
MIGLDEVARLHALANQLMEQGEPHKKPLKFEEYCEYI